MGLIKLLWAASAASLLFAGVATAEEAGSTAAPASVESTGTVDSASAVSAGNVSTATVQPSTGKTPDPGVVAASAQAGPPSVNAAEPGVGGEKKKKPLSGGGIEEIVVTATRRETKLEKTPVAVTALTDETLQRQQMVDLKSVTALVPNMQIGSHSDSAAVDVALRGIVSTNRTELGDPAVAFHVDGFYSPRPQGATTLLYDVERIEVLRGPQGTLFGRNSTAGVINVVTNKPDLYAASVYADAAAGNYSMGRFQGHLNAPLVDGKLGLRGAFYLDRRDGFIDFQPGSKVQPGAAKYDNSNKSSFRLSGLFTPTDSFTAYAAAEYFTDQGAGTIPVRIRPLDGTDLRSALVDSPGMLDLKNTWIHGRADLRPASWLEISYLGSWAQMTRSNVSDNDVGYNAAAGFQQEHRTHDSRFLSQSHELQMKSVDLPSLDLIAGGFFYREDNRIRFDIDISDDPNGDGVLDQQWAMTFIQPKRVLSSYAGYAQATWHALDVLRFTGGARYTHDNKSDTGGLNLVCPWFGATADNGGFLLRYLDDIEYAPDLFAGAAYPAGECGSFPGNLGNDANVTWTKLTWTGKAEWDVFDNFLLYGSASTGFQSGVIQDGGSHANPETVITYEVGAKTKLLGDKLVVNAAGFWSNYSDILRARAELQASGQQQMVTRNATQAVIRGVELEVGTMLTKATLLQLAASYLDAQYEDYPTIDNVFYDPADQASPVINLKGYMLPFAPKYSVSAALEHRFDLGEGRLVIPRVQSHAQSTMYLNDFNRLSDKQPAYSRTDLSLRYVTTSGWLAEVFVLNVEDVAVKSNVEIKGNQPGANGVRGFGGYAYAYFDPPRTYGVRLAYTWSQ